MIIPGGNVPNHHYQQTAQAIQAGRVFVCVLRVTGVASQGRCRTERFEPVAGSSLGTLGPINLLRSRGCLGVTCQRQVVPTVFQNLCIISCAATWLCSPLHSAVEASWTEERHSIVRLETPRLARGRSPPRRSRAGIGQTTPKICGWLGTALAPPVQTSFSRLEEGPLISATPSRSPTPPHLGGFEGLQCPQLQQLGLESLCWYGRHGRLCG